MRAYYGKKRSHHNFSQAQEIFQLSSTKLENFPTIFVNVIVEDTAILYIVEYCRYMKLKSHQNKALLHNMLDGVNNNKKKLYVYNNVLNNN